MALGEYIVSEAKTNVLISGLDGINEAKGEAGDQDPEMNVRCIDKLVNVLVKSSKKAGVISKSPGGVVEDKLCSGFGSLVENGAEVAGRVLAKVRRRFGSVTSSRTETL
jgi:hypothetical protein